MKQKINKEIATNLIIEGIKDYNNQVIKKNQLPISTELELFSENGMLDSLGLVNLIMSIEEKFEDYLDTSIVIADEKAMSQKNSPFQSVHSMADYLSKELQNI